MDFIWVWTRATESKLKRGSLERTEGEGVQKADGRVPMTGLCISTKTLQLKDVYKRAFYSGGRAWHMKEHQRRSREQKEEQFFKRTLAHLTVKTPNLVAPNSQLFTKSLL